jgi:hypothetical protein
MLTPKKQKTHKTLRLAYFGLFYSTFLSRQISRLNQYIVFSSHNKPVDFSFKDLLYVTLILKLVLKNLFCT